MIIGPSTSLTLIASLQSSGNDAAWERFSELYEAPIRIWSGEACRRCGLSREAVAQIADEATTDAVTEIWNAIRNYRIERRQNTGGFRKWLNTITDRITWEKVRWHGKKRAQGSGDSAIHWQIENAPDPRTLTAACNDAIDRGLRIDAIALTLGSANDRDRQVFQGLLSVDKPSPDALKKMAAELGVSVPLLYQIKSRLLKKIQGEFDRLNEELDAL